MSWPGFFAPAAAWLFLLVPLLVLLYFLKLKRPRLQVPSLVLWRQVLADQRVNSPFQKFKRNILLLLQLLLLLLLVLAAMQPYLRSEAERAHRIPVLVDCSASMAAMDRPGGSSRIEEAKRRIAEMIDGLLPDQQMSIIRFSSTATRLTGFTNNRRILHEALEQVVVDDVAGDLQDALRIAEAMSRGQPFERVILFSDGNFPPSVDFALPFTLQFQKLPPAGPNLGITALNARRGGSDRWDVFVRLEAGGERTIAATVELLRDGQVAGNEDVAVTPDRPERLVFRVPGASASELQVRLKPDGFDALPSDNEAFLALRPIRNVLARVSPSLEPESLALRAMDEVVVQPGGAEVAASRRFDLVVSDQAEAAGSDAAVTLHVGVVPAELSGLLRVEKGTPTAVVDWRRGHPLLEHVELGDLVIVANPMLMSGASEKDLENRGFEVLAHGRQGPLLLERRQGPRADYFLLFHTNESTLPYRVGFPVLLSNLVHLALEQAGLAEQAGAATGVLPSLSLLPRTQYLVRSPGGQTRMVLSDNAGVVNGLTASRAGLYRLEKGGEPAATLGVSLLSPAETRLHGVDEIQFNELSVSANQKGVRVDRSFWPVVVWCALVVLLIEWWYFNRPRGVLAG